MDNVMQRVPCNNWFCTFNQRGYCINVRINSAYRENGNINCDMINDNNINMDKDRQNEDLYYQKELEQ